MSKDLFALLAEGDDFTDPVRETYERAPFGYPGGKSRSVDHVIPEFPSACDVFVEHMGGTGIITLNYRNAKHLHVFNDRCSGVTAFFRCIANYDKSVELADRLRFTIHSREEFIFCKETWENVEQDVERAARWYYMVQTSFANKRQAFARATHTRAPIKTGKNLDLFPAIHGRFREVQVENLDFRISAKDFDSFTTVHYFDPPYLGADSGIYTHKFQRQDHVDMLNLAFELDGFVAASSYPNDLYDSYPWTRRVVWEVPVTIKALAFTETNHQLNREDIDRNQATEALYIKDA